MLPIKKNIIFFFVTKPSYIKPTKNRRADAKIVSNLVSISRISSRELSFFLSPTLSFYTKQCWPSSIYFTPRFTNRISWNVLRRGIDNLSLAALTLVDGLTDERRSVTNWQRDSFATPRGARTRTCTCAFARAREDTRVCVAKCRGRNVVETAWTWILPGTLRIINGHAINPGGTNLRTVFP